TPPSTTTPPPTTQTPPPLIQTPPPVPKTGDSGNEWALAGLGISGIAFGLYKLWDITKTASNLSDKLKAQEDLELDDEPKRVVGSRKKTKEKNKSKRLRRN
ncbi:MAG: hypothetical protein K2G03_05760, partial [Bacilli bacterium]|nr:hypothetical protein [Bacilli bacterium]